MSLVTTPTEILVIVLWSTAEKCTEISVARAARAFFLFQPIIFLLRGVAVAVVVVFAKTPYCYKKTGRWPTDGMGSTRSHSKGVKNTQKRIHMASFKGLF